MKKFLIAALIAPFLMGSGCKDDDNNSPGKKSYPDRIPATERFPVVAWHGVRASHASVERFREAENMGITLNYSRMGNVETALKTLDYAAQTGVRLIVECDELYSDTERADAVRALMGHPGLAGYFMDDEPAPDKFEGIARRIKDIRAIDKEHMCYCNIFPTLADETYQQWGMGGYRDYVRKYLDVCDPEFLSFDMYPIVEAEGRQWVQPAWYPTLETAFYAARGRNLDLWAFMLTVPHTSYPQPTTDHLRLQAYSDLAYGAQALQCFTYWTPTVADPEMWNYRNAPIEEDGTRTETYDIVKGVLDEIQTVAWIFRGCKVEGVWHLGKTIPDMTKPLTAETMPAGAETIQIRDADEGLISVFTNHGYTFMLFQNTSVGKDCASYIKMKEGVRRIHRDGSVTPASDEAPAEVVKPGDVRIYMW